MDQSEKGIPYEVQNNLIEEWFQIILEKDQIESGAIYSIQLQFDEYFEKANRPDNMALYLDNFSKTNSHNNQLRLLFSPIAAHIAVNIINGYFGSPCLPPKKSEIDLLVGSNKSWDLLF